MARSVKRAKVKKKPVQRVGMIQRGAMALGGAISRNPVLVGSSTAFFVTLFYVSANALWYQPFAHSGAFFATRSVEGFPVSVIDEPSTTINIIRPEPADRPEGIAGDPLVRQVQLTLRDLGFYSAEPDGLSGPNTRDAIATYQRKVGLAETGVIDDALLEQLGASPMTIVPVPANRNEMTASVRVAGEPASATERISRIQMGLRAFGNADIEVDGIAGARTRAAISEFQSIFGLAVTGEPDAAVYARMRDVGLTQ
ncbi:peptidoglycan-binding protein [Aquamicrobium segne]|uniref:Peptidoglycan-binding protein n=1 Tax=Aquamicrobium segne TaxID=469547 RepID=A0ABW0GWS7_9HYPH